MSEIRDALKILVERLEEIGRSSELASVFALYESHGFRYSGPNWVEELARARAALLKGDDDGCPKV
jgi:hypothetical protein